jgi:SAM-dependent methyltransferase
MTDTGENWNRAYFEAPEIFDAFCRAEDPDGRISRRLTAHARLGRKVVLEIGCGTGRYAREWAGLAERYFGVERSPGMLALAQRNCADESMPLEFICGDAARLPFPDETFDRMIAGWVVVNLRPAVRCAVLAEASRVLRAVSGADIWLIENHWSGEFQELRGRRAEVEKARIKRLADEWGFEPVEVVETELRFPDARQASHILGWLCGKPVRRKLEERPTHRLSHHVVLLHLAAGASIG